MTYYELKIESPVGELTLVANDSALTKLAWCEEGLKKRQSKSVSSHEIKLNKNSVLRETEKQLKEYFRGKRSEFDIPLHFEGTPFQIKVWKALQRIPYGETKSYGELAKYVGSPKACRAVGAANGRNPIAIIVPCHRVIGASGDLTGFGGGIGRKEILLNIERTSEKFYCRSCTKELKTDSPSYQCKSQCRYCESCAIDLNFRCLNCQGKLVNFFTRPKKEFTMLAAH